MYLWRVGREGLEPTLSNNRLKNEGLEPTLSNGQFKKVDRTDVVDTSSHFPMIGAQLCVKIHYLNVKC